MTSAVEWVAGLVSFLVMLLAGWVAVSAARTRSARQAVEGTARPAAPYEDVAERERHELAREEEIAEEHRAQVAAVADLDTPDERSEGLAGLLNARGTSDR